MPHALLLHLTPTIRTNNPKDLSLYAHGLFYHLLEQIDPVMSAQVHAAKLNPFTLWAKGDKGGVLLRVTTLDDTLFKPLLQVALQESLGGLSLGQDRYSVSRVLATPEGHKDAGACSWEEVLEATGTDRLELTFLTPTVFSTSRSDGKRQYTPLPLPRLIAMSLFRTFQTYSPKPYSDTDAASFEALLSEALVVTRHEVRTQVYRAGKTTLTGFTGSATLRYLDKDVKVQQLLGQLARLAYFSGVGAKTPYGMGQVRLRTARTGAAFARRDEKPASEGRGGSVSRRGARTRAGRDKHGLSVLEEAENDELR